VFPKTVYVLPSTPGHDENDTYIIIITPYWLDILCVGIYDELNFSLQIIGGWKN
jgi:hypothetical protein